MPPTTLTMDDAIAKAIDTKDAALAGRVADTLRVRGFTYTRVLARVQKIRPAVTAADWEELMVEAEELEATS